MHKFIGILVVFLALFLAACHPTPVDSGIEGLVTVGPVSPVEQPGVTNERPYQATIVVKDVDGKTVTTIRSDTDGRFRVELEPGTYVLEPQSPGQLPYAEPIEVAVEPHLFTEVAVPYDSGIR